MIKISRGSLYLDAAVYDLYFAGLEAVILLGRGDDLLIMPVRNTASGGYLLKLKNSAGDRIVNAMDFFHEQGIGNQEASSFPVTWNQQAAALIVKNAFKTAK